MRSLAGRTLTQEESLACETSHGAPPLLPVFEKLQRSISVDHHAIFCWRIMSSGTCCFMNRLWWYGEHDRVCSCLLLYPCSSHATLQLFTKGFGVLHRVYMLPTGGHFFSTATGWHCGVDCHSGQIKNYVFSLIRDPTLSTVIISIYSKLHLSWRKRLCVLSWIGVYSMKKLTLCIKGDTVFQAFLSL